MTTDRFDKLLAFLERLDAAKLHYNVSHHREEAISVEVFVPGEHWEVDFLADGDVDVERFRSNGHIDDESALNELFTTYGEPESTPEEAVNHDDATARK
jgi:hypothetical protein